MGRRTATPSRPVVGTDGLARGTVEVNHRRSLATVFGTVDVTRLAYAP